MTGVKQMSIVVYEVRERLLMSTVIVNLHFF